MTRDRRPEDWDRDLAAARAVEQAVGAALAADPRVAGLKDATAAFDRLTSGSATAAPASPST